MAGTPGAVRADRIDGREGPFAGRRGRGGFPRRDEVHPERREEHTRGEVFALIDGYIHRHNHDRIKQSFGWMSPVQYRLSHGLAV